MDVEKQGLLDNNGSSPPSAPPPAYSPAQYAQTPTQYPSQLPPGYSQQNPTQYPSQVPPGYNQQTPAQYPSQVPPGYNPTYPPQRAPNVTVVTAVPVPQREVWHSSRGGVLPQPDQNRVVIGGTARYRYGMLMSTSYTYADQLPCLTTTMMVFLVMCIFLGTPVSLLCSIPGYYYVHKVSNYLCTVYMYKLLVFTTD